MARQRLEKVESRRGNCMGSDASNLQHLVHGRGLSARARVPDVVGSRRPSPYNFRAGIQPFQGVAAPFPTVEATTTFARTIRPPGAMTLAIARRPRRRLGAG